MDSTNNIPPDPNPDHILEFQIADLDQRPDRGELLEKVFEEVGKQVDNVDIKGFDLVPHRWPEKVVIYCANKQAKECLLIRGIGIYGKYVEFNEPGHGAVTVTIHDAPLNMPNVILKEWLEQFGIVSEFRNDHYKYKGRRTTWRVGARVARVKSLKQSVPPSAKLKFGEQQVTISV